MTGQGPPDARAVVDLIETIDRLLPQTQCTRCGYPACRPYAEAIAREGAPINQCPPGGAAGIAKLAAATGRAALALNPSNGVEGPLRVARVDEARCIGCTLCIAACPTDAIVGAARALHVVLAAECTGCELCIAPCPVDCIDLLPAAQAWDDTRAARARERYVAREARLAKSRRRRQSPGASDAARLSESVHGNIDDHVPANVEADVDARVAENAERGVDGGVAGKTSDDLRRQRLIDAALERARARRTRAGSP